MQHLVIGLTKLIVDLTTGAELAGEGDQGAVDQESSGVLDHRLEAGLGQLGEPLGQIRPIVADGLDEGLS